MPVLPLIICGAFNMQEDEARQRIANPIGGQFYSNANVDHIIVRNGQDVTFDENLSVTRMGMFISDHPALPYRISFVMDEPSQVVDWTLY